MEARTNNPWCTIRCIATSGETCPRTYLGIPAFLHKHKTYYARYLADVKISLPRHERRCLISSPTLSVMDAVARQIEKEVAVEVTVVAFCVNIAVIVCSVWY
jgi:hypothetical protein